MKMIQVRVRSLLAIVAVAFLAASSGAWAQEPSSKEDKPLFPDFFAPPADDFTRGFADERKDVQEVNRPLPQSGPVAPSPLCGPSSPTC